MQERIDEKEKYINKRKWRKDGPHPGNGNADNDFDEGAANEEKAALNKTKPESRSGACSLTGQ